jgi:sialate O-acetylesterase
MKRPSLRPRHLIGWLSLAVSVMALRAEPFTLPGVIGDNMVLQRGQPVPIWGWTAPGTAVRVEFAGQIRTATAQADGRWEVRLESLAASAVPATMTITAGGRKALLHGAPESRRVLTNILVGEVWLASGQSNMEKPIGEQRGQLPVLHHERELAESDYPQIRLFKVAKTVAATPQTSVTNSGWVLSNSNSHEALKFSAAAYFFGRELHRELKVPIGLIEAAWGGTRIEPWTPPVGFSIAKGLKGQISPPDAATKFDNRTPTALYNGMIAPLVPFALRGAIWYQGEANCVGDTNRLAYADKMEALILGWRRVWRAGTFPFFYVQLAPYRYHTGRPQPRVDTPEALPLLWQAQTRALRIRNTGMAVTTDLVDDLGDIHPRNKQDVGKRLALLALAKTYGRKDVVCSGPVFKSLEFRGNKAVLRFAETHGGLVSKDGKPLTWFAVAGSDGRFIPASAEIVGDTVEVSSASLPRPRVVSFGWDETAQPNLFNGAGLPARPFRTDLR